MSSLKNAINTKYILVTFFAVVASWILHELAHWAMGTMLDYEMSMTLNKTFPTAGKFNSDKHYQLVSAAGPLFTLIEATAVFFLLQRKKLILLYPFLFTCFYMRLFAAIISIRNPNDEARISRSIGLGTFTLPVIMVAILFLLIYITSLKNKLTLKFNFANLGMVILFSSIIILADQFWKIRLL